MGNQKGRKKIEPALVAIALLLFIVFVMLAKVVIDIPIDRPGLEGLVAENLNRSGVISPVTAVLLNFRGYDTLLEVMVLFLAVLGCWSMTEAYIPGYSGDTSPIQTALIRLLIPLMIIVAAYMVWQGSHFAGGAFQGGAVIAGAGVLLLVSNLPWLRNIWVLPLRTGLVVGPLVFLFIAFSCLTAGGKLLQYPEKRAGMLLLIIEIFCAISIGLTLAALFAGGRPEGDLPAEKMPPEFLKKGTEK